MPEEVKTLEVSEECNQTITLYSVWINIIQGLYNCHICIFASSSIKLCSYEHLEVCQLTNTLISASLVSVSPDLTTKSLGPPPTEIIVTALMYDQLGATLW